MFRLLFSGSADLGPSGLHFAIHLETGAKTTQSEGRPTKGPALPLKHGIHTERASNRERPVKQGGQARADCLPPRVELCWRIWLAAGC